MTSAPDVFELHRKIELAIESGLFDAASLGIDCLDAMDGDPDVEPCLAGDDGCQYFRVGGKEGWGYDFDPSDNQVAEYGLDQSADLPSHCWGA